MLEVLLYRDYHFSSLSGIIKRRILLSAPEKVPVRRTSHDGTPQSTCWQRVYTSVCPDRVWTRRLLGAVPPASSISSWSQVKVQRIKLHSNLRFPLTNFFQERIETTVEINCSTKWVSLTMGNAFSLEPNDFLLFPMMYLIFMTTKFVVESFAKSSPSICSQGVGLHCLLAPTSPSIFVSSYTSALLHCRGLASIFLAT